MVGILTATGRGESKEPFIQSLNFQIFGFYLLHCKDKMPKIWNKYSQKRIIGVSVPISTFMCLWAHYIYPRWVCLFCWRKYVDRSWEYINRSQTHECGNWGWGRAIPRKGINKRNCRCSVWWESWQPLDEGRVRNPLSSVWTSRFWLLLTMVGIFSATGWRGE
jgi:hypothetical protein